MWVETYKAIATKLDEIRKDSGESVFEYIDLDRKQIQSKDFPQNLLPIALVSFLNVPWTDASDDYQQGELSFAVDCYFEGYGNSFHGAAAQDETLSHLLVLDQLFEALQNLNIEGINITPFTRSANQQLSTTRPKTFGYRIVFSGQVAQAIPDNRNIRPAEAGEINDLNIIEHGFPG